MPDLFYKQCLMSSYTKYLNILITKHWVEYTVWSNKDYQYKWTSDPYGPVEKNQCQLRRSSDVRPPQTVLCCFSSPTNALTAPFLKPLSEWASSGHPLPFRVHTNRTPLLLPGRGRWQQSPWPIVMIFLGNTMYLHCFSIFHYYT